MGNSKVAMLVLMGLGACTFGASYGLSLWLGPAVHVATGQEAKKAPPTTIPGMPASETAEPPLPRLEEKHLMALVRQVRAKLEECRQREADLASQEQRLVIAREDLRREAQRLEALRAQVVAATTKLQKARSALEQTRLRITADEQANLKHTAEVYDNMDATAAAAIFESMCKNNQTADAVKIFHYMKERSVAKVLEAFQDRSLAAEVCQQMKRVNEPKNEG